MGKIEAEGFLAIEVYKSMTTNKDIQALGSIRALLLKAMPSGLIAIGPINRDCKAPNRVKDFTHLLTYN